MPHGRESFERLEAETPIFARLFVEKGACLNCEWTLWDGLPHDDPPPWGLHSSGCRDPYHCGPCDNSEAIAELNYEMWLHDTGRM